MFEEHIKTWKGEDQKLHSLLWDTFVNIETPYDAGKFRDRYELKHGSEAYRALTEHFRTGEAPRLRKSFYKMATWVVASRYYAEDDEDKNAQEFRRIFKELFGFDVAAESSRFFNRPFLPPMPEIGIDAVSLRIATVRPFVRAELEATVLTPFQALRECVIPGNWSSCVFWADLPPARAFDSQPESTLDVEVRLPGGDRIERAKTKARPVRLQVESSSSPFEARIDYMGRERKIEGSTLVEIDEVAGSLVVEKLKGRPGACRYVAERQASFRDFNHHIFGGETVMYWLASELLAFAEDARGRKG